MRILIAWVFAWVTLVALLDAALLDDAGAAETVSRTSDGDVELVAQVDRTNAQVVEPVEVTLTLRAPVGTQVILPKLTTQLGEFEVAGVKTTSDVPDRADADKRVWTAKIVLETLQAGAVSIPPLDVQYRLPAGEAFQTLSSDSIAIQIDSLLEDRVDPTDFRDIKPVIDVAQPAARSRAWIVWMAATTGIILAVATGVFLVARRRNVISPSDWTLSQLAQLESTIDTQPAASDLAYSELTMILEEFVGMQYGDDDVGSSDAARLDGTEGDWRVPPPLRPGLKEILSLAGEVKFAKRPVTETQVRQSIQQARQWVLACVREASPRSQEAA